MTETAGLIVQLRANVAQLEQGMQRAQKALDRAASQMERRTARFTNRFNHEVSKSARESASVFEQAFGAERAFGQLEQQLNPGIACQGTASVVSMADIGSQRRLRERRAKGGHQRVPTGPAEMRAKLSSVAGAVTGVDTTAA